jgi:hypothetical protein
MVTSANISDKIVLEIMIDLLRKEMIRIGTQEGLTSENTIMVSQQLDTYIIKYQKFISAMCNTS